MPYRGVPFYPHDTGTMRLMQPIKLHKGVPVTTLPKYALTNCRGPVNAETPRVHSRIPSGQPQIIHLKPNIILIIHPHTMGKREQKIRATQVMSLPSNKK